MSGVREANRKSFSSEISADSVRDTFLDWGYGGLRNALAMPSLVVYSLSEVPPRQGNRGDAFGPFPEGN